MPYPPPAPLPHTAPERSTTATSAVWGLCLTCCSAILLGPALWNGFAIIFFDTGGYVGRVLEMSLAPGRSLFYGLFLWVASGGWWSFWGPVLAQSLFTLWLIRLALRCHSLPAGPLATAIICAALGLLTGISWYTSQLMPDALAPLVVLGLWILAFGWKQLTRVERAGVSALVLLGILSHMSTMALAIGLIPVALGCGMLLRRCQWPAPLLPLPSIMVTGAGILLMPVLHLALVGQAVFTPGGPVFVFGRLVQDGIAQRWLAEHCPAPGVRLCALQDRMPATADDFLWGDASPFHDIGGWSAEATTELQRLTHECVTAYPGMFVWTSLRSTFLQLGKVATGDGLDEFQPAAHAVFTNLLPKTAETFTAARQQQGQISQSLFDALNAIHIPVAHLSLFGLVWTMGWGLRTRRYDLTALALFIFLALLGNAFICGALSNPHDRYQSRLVWLATLVTSMAAASHYFRTPQKNTVQHQEKTAF